MILHTVNTSPFRTDCLRACLRFIGEGDAVVLLEDGVYGASLGVETGLDALPDLPIYAITADVEARGLADRISDRVQLIDYNGFVELCTRYALIKNWS